MQKFSTLNISLQRKINKEGGENLHNRTLLNEFIWIFILDFVLLKINEISKFNFITYWVLFVQLVYIIFVFSNIFQ